MKHKDIILRGLAQLRGDDYERAQRAFRNCTPEQMQQEYGQSGQTRQQILDGYRDHVESIEAASAWGRSQP